MTEDSQRDLPLDERAPAPRSEARPAGTPVARPLPTSIQCPNCGYNLTGVQLGSACPECNLIIGRGALGGPTLPTSGYAVASLVLGICSITIGCGTYGVLSIICGPLALIFSRKATLQIREGGMSGSSNGLKTAGFVTGLIGTIVGALAMVGIVLFFVALIMAGQQGGSGGYTNSPSPSPVLVPPSVPAPVGSPSPATAPHP